VTPLDWNQSLGCRSIEKKQIRLQENFKMVSNITECKGKREWSGVENLGKGNRFFWNGREKVSLPLCFNGLFFFFFCRWYRPIRGFGILMGQMLDGCDLKAVVLRARAVLGMGGTMVMWREWGGRVCAVACFGRWRCWQLSSLWWSIWFK